ncbi:MULTISPECIES: indolepyruvate ferredoxin oxidoreductase family protein [unclassified Sphingobium]|uniref:indolepyruvate ferredoxin oxidoreductase family protein n=1 Tax=unclassified Sphingobium TaxID=2611147 RepID=UPI00077024B4|nr:MULTISPECIES: indolepyruvate ferredoxin oxidoreductase family protein [unclassified Sphingobium]AMK21106.1 indolepyruvate ferredoxin oxidoreductase [Sphingobium sp. TKS]NML89692.1 indolepyruvate ferredoxin oxidoreductase family protein [Sphingobium sp. TB-6]
MDKHAPVSLEDKWAITRGRILLNGTQALVRVLLSQAWLDQCAGLRTAGYISGYRGSPLGNVDTTLWSVGKRLEQAGIRFQPGVNEDLAVTAIAGTQQIDQVPGARYDGVYSAWYGKGPGVDRSGDAFKHGNYAGAHRNGGVVLFYGDDHSGKSSTVAYQSEQAIAANLIPSFYPADVGEILHFGLLALALSRHSGTWAAVKCVTEVVEQTASVDIDLDTFAPIMPAIPAVPPEGLHAKVRPFNPLRAEQIVVEYRLPSVIPFVRANGIDRTIFRAPEPRLAIVSAGKSYGDVRQALALLEIDEARATALGISLFKVGCIWPLDAESIAAFARGHDTLLIVEEKRSFIEAQTASALVNDPAAPRLIGKADEAGAPLLSSVTPLQPEDIARVIADRLKRLGVEFNALAPGRGAAPAGGNTLPTLRTPYFCSGCPHNRSTRIPDGSLSMTGIGCHTMAAFATPEKALLPTQMGGEGLNWTGLAPFTDTPHMFQNMGDGTYYHSGTLAIRAAVASGANMTYKILYNDAVAMTGGQPIDGPISVAKIAHQVLHEGVKRVVLLSDNPDLHRRDRAMPAAVAIHHRDALERIQRELRETQGCTVLIYEQTCAAEKRRRRKRGELPDPPKRMFIAEDVCEGCGDCTVQSSCMSIMPKETAFGRKRTIDQSSCNKDYSCADGFCPSFITVRDAEPVRPRGADIDDTLFEGLPEPRRVEGSWNIMVAGVGGTGVITVGALIAMAAHVEGRAVSLFDMTGLAQKNGAVFSHIRVAATSGEIRTQRLGRGEADLLIAFDLIAALSSDAIATLRHGHTRVLANSFVMPTAAFQSDRDAPSEAEILMARLIASAGEDRCIQIDAAALARRITGDTMAANLVLLGMAAQSGLLPVSTVALERAIMLNGVAVKANITAMRLGRVLVADAARLDHLTADRADRAVTPQTFEDIVTHRSAHLSRYQDDVLAKRYRDKMAVVHEAEQRAAARSEALSRVVAVNYARLLAIKDEYEVARMLTDPVLRRSLSETFGDGARLSFNMAPPFLPGRAANGRPRKREIPWWLAFPALRLLAQMRGLRGTALDIFGSTAERRRERALLRDYEALVDRTVARLSADNLAAATRLLDEVSAVRGYGPVKDEAMSRYFDKIRADERLFSDGDALDQPDVAAFAT